MEASNDELYEYIWAIKKDKYELQDQIELILDYLLHSHITLEEMYKIGEIVNE